MSQNELNNNINWKSKKNITEFIKTREKKMQDFIRTHLLGLDNA